MTSALERGEGSASRPGRTLPLGKTRYPLYRRLGGPQDRSGQVRKISPPPGFDPPTVKSVTQLLYQLSNPAHHYITRLESNTVEPSYNDIALCVTSPIASDVLLY
jgi:hypothetical protein